MQSGANTWTVAYKDYALPQMKPGVNKGKLRSSYTLKLQVWAEGTYVTDASGKPLLEGGKIVPLKNGAKKPAAKTKPTIVTVKVNLK